MVDFTIKQGDAYKLPVRIKLDGEPVAESDVSQVEFMLGRDIRHTWPEDAEYADGLFRLPLTQAETLSLPAGLTLPLDVRVKLITGDVLGARRVMQIRVLDALSTEEL